MRNLVIALAELFYLSQLKTEINIVKKKIELDPKYQGKCHGQQSVKRDRRQYHDISKFKIQKRARKSCVLILVAYINLPTEI